jgi:hypothetical protein
MVVAAWCTGHRDDPGCSTFFRHDRQLSKRENLFAAGMLACLLWVAVLSLRRTDAD